MLWNLTAAFAAAALLACAAQPRDAEAGDLPESTSLSSDGRAVKWRGTEYYPIDDSGIFYYDASQAAGCPMPDPLVDLGDALAHNGFGGIVRCRLVDYVDCSGASHNLRESGASRVLRIGDTSYRITPPAGKLSWFSYDLATSPTPGMPHLVVCQLINDRERYTTLTLNHAENTAWADPYAGEEKYVPKNQEGNTWRCDVGAAVYTGREYHCNGKPYTFSMLFYPKTEKAKITISHRSNEIDFDELNGAAVARIWMFDILDPLPEAVPEPAARFGPEERKLALYVPHPWFLYSHFGIPSRTGEQRVKSLEEMVKYLRFCGFNQLQLHIINGSDRASMAWYDSKLYPQLEGDLFKELLPIVEREGIEMVPIVAPIMALFNKKPHEVPETPDERGWSRDSCLLDRDGEDYTRAFGAPAPNPLRPEVQQWQIECFREILDRCAQSPAVPAVGFRVNGKIGLCFTGEGWDRCGQDAGYNHWMVEQFTKDTGIHVPRQEPTSYQYIKENCWDEWLQWRCVKTREFWLKCRDFIRSYRPDLRFLATCDLPSEWPGYNLEWPSGQHTIRDLFRHHGYDPELFRQDEGIWIQRGMMVGSDRYWWESWNPPKANAWAHKMLNYAPGVAESYQAPDSSGVELYHNYWEEDPHPDNQYGPYMRTATPVAYKDFFYEPAVFSLRKVNVDRIVLMGWERACAGHEHDLRRFARAFRAIPKGEPKEFDGSVQVLSDGPRLSPDQVPEHYTKPEMDVLWAAWYGDRLAIVNDAFCSREVKVKLKAPLAKGRRVFEHGSERVVYTAASDGPAEFALSLRPFDLKVLSVVDQPASEKLARSPALPLVRDEINFRAEAKPGAIIAGGESELGFNLSNGTKSPLSDIIVNVRLPRGWTEKSGDARVLKSLPAGQSHTFRVRFSVPISQAGSSGMAKMTATLTGPRGSMDVDADVFLRAEFPVKVSQSVPVYAGCAGETVRAGITLANTSDAAVSGKVRIELPAGWKARELAEISLDPGRSINAPLDIAIPDSASPRRIQANVRFVVDGQESQAAPVAADVVMNCPKAEVPPVIDGTLSEWPQDAVVIDTNQFRAGEGAEISAVQVLAPRAWFSWDDTHLYIAARVNDGKFQNPFADHEMWKGDSLQFAIDVSRMKSGPRGFYEYGLTAGEKGGARAWRFRGAGGSEGGPASADGSKVAASPSGTVYEVALKWADLGFQPAPGEVVGIALVVNDFDGAKRRCLTFAEGLAGDKDPTKFIGLRLGM